MILLVILVYLYFACGKNFPRIRDNFIPCRYVFMILTIFDIFVNCRSTKNYNKCGFLLQTTHIKTLTKSSSTQHTNDMSSDEMTFCSATSATTKTEASTELLSTRDVLLQ